MLGLATGPALFLVLNPGTLAVREAVLGFASGCSAKGVELSVELGLRLDEAATVVAHGLVAGIWVLRRDGDHRGNQDDDQKDRRECGVVDEEYHTHYTSNNALSSVVSKLQE